jgi:two-component system, NtrC family, response regulator AtoC
VATSVHSVLVLVVSRDPATLRCLSHVGETNSWQLETIPSGLQALERAQSKSSPDLIVLELVPDDPDSMHTLRWLRKACPSMPVILLSQSNDHQRTVEALRLGARDFLIKPFHEQELEQALKIQLANLEQNEEDAISEEIERLNDVMAFVATSPAMKKVRAQVELLAQVNVPVLIVGEKGSGRKTTAQLIHHLSARSGSRFARVRCCTPGGDQLEKEVFGVDTGTVNGTTEHRPGEFEFCHRGTLLLEEISEMPPSLQVRVLRALQQQRILRRGSEKTVLDVRVLATNTKELSSENLRGNGNGDLMTCLSAFKIHVPPLRHHTEDIPVLLDHFMKRLARRHGLRSRKFSNAALDVCEQYSWPDNVQGLKNFVKAYLVLGDESLRMLGAGTLSREDANPHPDRSFRNRLENSKSDRTNGKDTLTSAATLQSASLKSLVRSVREEAERNAIAGALKQTRWNRKAAARLLQISYRALLYKIDEYRMTPEESYLAAMAATTPVKNSPS